MTLEQIQTFQAITDSLKTIQLDLSQIMFVLFGFLVFILIIQLLIGLIKKTSRKKLLLQQPGWIIIFFSTLLVGIIAILTYIFIRIIIN